MIKVDKSRLMCFIKSPKEYEEIYIIGKPFITTPAIERGKRFHDFAENYWKIIEYDGENLTLPEVETEDDELNMMIKNYKDFLRKRFLKCKEGNFRFFPTAVERVFEKRMVVGNHHIRLKGIIDFYDDYFDNKVIGELKTGNEYPSHEFELNFYRWMMQQFDIDIPNGVVYYPSKHKLSFYRLNKMDEVLIEVIKFIEYHKEKGWKTI